MSASIDVIINFDAGLIHGIINWLGEDWQGISAVVRSLFSLFFALLNSIWIFLKQDKVIPFIQAIGTPITLTFIALFVTWRLEKDKQKQQQEDKLQATLSDYLKQMTTLLLDKELSTKDHKHPTARVARVLTLTAIKALDSARNQQLTNFLVEANLIQRRKAEDKSNSPLLLQKANLNFANLTGANLYLADLNGAHLYLADLNGAKLKSAELNLAILERANLNFAKLNSAILISANLMNANLNGANLMSANLLSANLTGANLMSADLNFAKLDSADLVDADLRRANLKGANLMSADLTGANLKGANLERATFGNNEGINEKMKANLKRRGAIFPEESTESSKNSN